MVILLLALGLFSCDKDDQEEAITGTVTAAGGCFPNSWIVLIDNAKPSDHPFICENGSLSSSMYNCGNSVYISDMPASLAQPGKRVTFTRWGLKASCFSATYAPSHLEVYDLRDR